MQVQSLGWEDPLKEEMATQSSILARRISRTEEPQFSSVQSFSYVQLFATPWAAARQAFLSITNSRSYSNLCTLTR